MFGPEGSPIGRLREAHRRRRQGDRTGSNPALKARMAELESERVRRLSAQSEALAPAPPVQLHPNLPELYRRQVERLEAALNDPMIRDEAAEVLRELIEKVVLQPRAGGKGLDAVLHGDLVQILQLCAAADQKNGGCQRKLPGQGGPGSRVSVVAGEGFEPSTFRL